MILGITPARGGSKGIPRKNIRPLCGKPLIVWTIEAAQGSRLLDQYVVSTEDPEIAAVARRYGARVLARPVELAGDEVDTLDVLQHALSVIPADVVVVLQATSPIRDEGLIDRCIQRFLDTNVDALATGFICKNVEYGTGTARRQDLIGFPVDDGSVYVIKSRVIRGRRQHGKTRELVITDREQNVDIDDEFDFWLAEQVLRRRGHSLEG